MNLKLEDVYKAYKELETTIEQFRESKFKTLSALLGYDRATWAVLKFGPTGSEKVYLAEISTEGNIEKISFENFAPYSDRVAYTN